MDGRGGERALQLTPLRVVEDGNDIHGIFVREEEAPAGRDVERALIAGRCQGNIRRICGWREAFDQGAVPAVSHPSAGLYEGRGDR